MSSFKYQETAPICPHRPKQTQHAQVLIKQKPLTQKINSEKK